MPPLSRVEERIVLELGAHIGLVFADYAVDSEIPLFLGVRDDHATRLDGEQRRHQHPRHVCDQLHAAGGRRRGLAAAAASCCCCEVPR